MGSRQNVVWIIMLSSAPGSVLPFGLDTRRYSPNETNAQ